MKKFFAIPFAAGAFLLSNCSNPPAAGTTPAADTASVKKAYQQTIGGKPVSLYFLTNASGAQVAITNYGGRVVSLVVPDKNGKPTDVVLGYDSLSHYLSKPEAYFGALIGRYGNRIADARFALDGTTYRLAANNGKNSLHGGPKGFHNQVWEAVQAGPGTLSLQYVSKDGEEGYPGTLTVKVSYTLTDNNELKIDYQAETDKKTVVNLTNHAYFNLNGQGDSTITDHLLNIMASKYSAVDSTLIPTGAPVDVAATPFDFRKAKPIGQDIGADNVQIKNGLGYDHNFVLDRVDAVSSVQAAHVQSVKTGISMEVFTTEPAIQFYSGNFLDGTLVGKQQKKYGHRSAFCLETQHFPDSPNQPAFPSTVLEPGKQYRSTTTYRFGVVKS
ncbi:aldose epimerase family protein [Sediminibacterium soli]|uniref:aldose epimerase family protein n=1 Tax=Sediminibacterium soli TaxID=2698829 RepID=UPI001F2D964F|nr:aldose epimerase family protein [Sediminibacterium soli]